MVVCMRTEIDLLQSVHIWSVQIWTKKKAWTAKEHQLLSGLTPTDGPRPKQPFLKVRLLPLSQKLFLWKQWSKHTLIWSFWDTHYNSILLQFTRFHADFACALYKCEKPNQTVAMQSLQSHDRKPCPYIPTQVGICTMIPAECMHHDPWSQYRAGRKKGMLRLKSNGQRKEKCECDKYANVCECNSLSALHAMRWARHVMVFHHDFLLPSSFPALSLCFSLSLS